MIELNGPKGAGQSGDRVDSVEGFSMQFHMLPLDDLWWFCDTGRMVMMTMNYWCCQFRRVFEPEIKLLLVSSTRFWAKIQTPDEMYNYWILANSIKSIGKRNPNQSIKMALFHDAWMGLINEISFYRAASDEYAEYNETDIFHLNAESC